MRLEMELFTFEKFDHFSSAGSSCTSSSTSSTFNGDRCTMSIFNANFRRKIRTFRDLCNTGCTMDRIRRHRYTITRDSRNFELCRRYMTNQLEHDT